MNRFKEEWKEKILLRHTFTRTHTYLRQHGLIFAFRKVFFVAVEKVAVVLFLVVFVCTLGRLFLGTAWGEPTSTRSAAACLASTVKGPKQKHGHGFFFFLSDICTRPSFPFSFFRSFSSSPLFLF
jgi:hypothetical protein